ncbi:MAG: type II toxin-antitoxin system PemK/MazF family toxin [Hyphomicrobium sp.]|uniref:type II toxin-antitoxin system PemK/MazF family toxin n=1 Tax=Hyphomicrobium sp. TaxID=82 RepID=UPI0025B88A14|nr:type II toxin-antitoxin system PemK/MazF family toxin [Hyphomicrobium sp.]MBZ0211059.1 type II toxin-antitoxin system PemK/MazF family toxin [Hyphomicrobium sp.]
MEKDFDRWNATKKKISGRDDERLFFHEGEVWWVHLGVNVGYEIDGKHAQFSRPVIVLKKYNQYSFLALPLTTNARPNKWRVPIGKVADEDAFAVLSQLRNIDSLRLIEKKGSVKREMLETLRRMASRMNFG